jgi:protein-disulfide isomerase
VAVLKRRASFTSHRWVATTRRTLSRIFARASFMLAALTVAVSPTAARAQGSEIDRVLQAPGLDFSRLPPAAKKELSQVFTDEFDYCGRPLTIAASLKKDPCKHTRRLAVLAGVMANEGVNANEIITQLGKYNQTFQAKRIAFKHDERQCKGASAADAKITIAEFVDFECPYCNAVRPIIADVLKRKKDVRVCYQPFPLSGHANAIPATNAALLARDAGKFWPVHDALFDNQTQLSTDFIKGILKKNGLDPEALDKAIAENKFTPELNLSKELGKQGGVDATPTLFLNGRKLALNPTAEALSVGIEDELDWAAGKSAWPSN